VATVQLTSTGSYPLPNLSRLVEKGIHFTRAWAHPICAPTRATVFSGLSPWKNTIGDAAGNPVLPAKLPSDGTTDLKTLGNFVSEAGYQCGFFGKWDLGDDDQTTVPTARGWHRHEGILAGGLRFIPEDPPRKAEYEQIIQQDVRYVSWEKVIGDAQLGTVQKNITPEQRPYKYATEDNLFAARDWIKTVAGSPWWVTLAVLAPHDPFHVPPKDTYTVQFKDPANPTEQEMFLAMMESFDHYLGKFFNDPQIQNELRNSVIIFVGDNGSDDILDLIAGDDKASTCIGGVHVPLVVADGGMMCGQGPCLLDAGWISNEKHEMVHIVDLFQTIIDIANGPVPGHGPPAPPPGAAPLSGPSYNTDSVSILPHLRQTAGDPRFASWRPRAYNFSQFFVPPNITARFNQLGEQATISDGNYKLNYQNGNYEFSELRFDPATDITTEIVTNDFQHPKAQELWLTLTTPGGPYYAEINEKGKKFPPLPAEQATGPEVLGVGSDYQLWYREELTSNWVQVPGSGAVLDVTIMPDGKILGVGTDQQLWYREELTSPWINVPGSVAVISITVMADGKILGVGTDQQLWYRENLTSAWVQVPNSGAVTGITIMADGKILGVGTDQQLWYRENLTSPWINVPNSGLVIGVAILPDGKILGIGTDYQLCYRAELTSAWVQVPNSGAVIGVTNATTARRYKIYT